jgi:hypothetical protein
MAVRVGIELSPAACRIVEIDRAWRRRWLDTRVKSFAVLPPGGFETEAKLASLRKATAGVVVWGVPSDHRQVMVTDGSYERMRNEALSSLAGVGLETGGLLADIASTPREGDKEDRRSVVIALAAAPMISAALAPLVAAGIEIRTIMTPPAALLSLGRMRRVSPVPHAIEAYVALEETATCIALIRDGALITARELPWGFIDAAEGRTHVRRREEIAERLGDELSASFAGIGAVSSAVSQICVCGGLPELRSMTVGLTERLDIEVEPLDSLFGIDAARLPKRADEFRERSSELRLAWAAAADWHAKINLLRARQRQAAKVVLSRAAVVSGVAVGLGIGWGIERTNWWRSIVSTPQPRTATNLNPPAPVPRSPAGTAPPLAPPVRPAPTAPVATGPQTSTPMQSPAPLPALPSPQVTVPPAAARVPPAAPAPPLAAKTPAPPVGPSPSQLPRPMPAPPVARSDTRPAPPVPPPPTASQVTPPRTAPSPRSTAPPDAIPAPPTSPAQAPSGGSLLSPSRPQATAPSRRGQTAPPPKAEVALPFEATLGTILFSPDRKLAIIDGRIVGVGDEIRGARVTDITASAVFLRDAQGRLRRLALSTTGR